MPDQQPQRNDCSEECLMPVFVTHAAPRTEDGDLCESACLVWADCTGSQAALVSRVRPFLLPWHRAPTGDIPRVDAPLISHQKVRQFLLVPGALSHVLQPQTPTTSHMAVTTPAGGRSLLTLSRTARWPRIIQASVTSGGEWRTGVDADCPRCPSWEGHQNLPVG